MNRPLSETETIAISLLKQYNDGRNENINKVSDRWAALFSALVNDGHAINAPAPYFYRGPILKDHPFALESLRAMVTEQTKDRDAARMALEIKQAALDKATAELDALQQSAV